MAKTAPQEVCSLEKGNITHTAVSLLKLYWLCIYKVYIATPTNGIKYTQKKISFLSSEPTFCYLSAFEELNALVHLLLKSLKILQEKLVESFLVVSD